MSAFKKKHGIRVNYQPIRGKNDDSNERYQQNEAIQSQQESRESPETVVAPRDTRGFSLKIEALLKLLEKPDQGKGGDDDGDEIEERVGDDEVDDEDVRLSHPFQVHVATEVVDGGRHGK